MIHAVFFSCMNAASPILYSGKVLVSTLTAFQLLFFNSAVYAAPSQAVGQIHEIKPVGAGKYLLTLVKGTEKTSIAVNELTVIRVAVPAATLEVGDTVWMLPGSRQEAKETETPAPAESPGAEAPGLPKPPASQPLAVPPPPIPPQPPKMPPQPPKIPEMPKPPEVPQPPERPPMPPGQKPPEAPAEAEQPQQQETAAEQQPASEQQSARKEKTEIPTEEPEPDSLAPGKGPLTASEDAEGAADKSMEKIPPVPPEMKGNGAGKIVKKENAEAGILLEIENEKGTVEEQVYQAETPLLKLSLVDALVKGMIAHIEYTQDPDEGFLAQNITATSQDSLRMS